MSTAVLERQADLQARAGAHSTRRRPRSSPYRQVVSAIGAVGDLAEALDYASANPDSPTRDRRVLVAAANVVTAMLVLVGRWWPEEDLLAMVAARLERLEGLEDAWDHPVHAHRQAAHYGSTSPMQTG